MPTNLDNQKSERRYRNEKDLVSEQPGFFILFIGLLAAVVVGFSIKTAAGSDWFRERLREAISNVGKTWRIEHGEVGLYFKDGIKPSIGFYVEAVKIASESSCFMKAGGFAQKVKIPLSLINYIVDGQLVSEIDIEGFKVELTESSPICDTNEFSVEKSEQVGKKKKNQITIIDRVEKSQFRNEIQIVRIDRLEIYWPHEKYNYFLLKDIQITNKSAHPKILFMEGNLDLDPYFKTGEGASLASLKIEYNEFPEKIIKSNLLGALREGFFSFQLVNRMDDDKFQLQAELKNMSLSLLKSFSEEFPKDLNLKSNWISMKLYSEGLSKTVLNSSLQMKDILINGDLGELSIDSVDFPKGFKGSHSDFQIKMRALDLSKTAELIPHFKVPKQIDSLGVLDGYVDVGGKNTFTLNARVLGVGIIFSANGVRQAEKLNIGRLGGTWAENNFLIESDSLQLENYNLLGFFRIKSKGMKLFDMDAELKDLQLSESVSELVTGVEGQLKFDKLALKLSGDNESVDYKVNGQIKTFTSKYVLGDNLVFNILGVANKSQEIEIKADQLNFTPETEKILSQYELALPMTSLKTKIKITERDQVFHLKYDAGMDLRMDAELSAQNLLIGQILTKDQTWKVNGTRDDIKINKK